MQNTLENDMTQLALDPSARLTDALERDILEKTLNEQTAAHPIAVAKRAAVLVAAAFGNFFDFVDEVQETMNRARQQSARFSGSQW
jgi:hypothetical protein